MFLKKLSHQNVLSLFLLMTAFSLFAAFQNIKHEKKSGLAGFWISGNVLNGDSVLIAGFVLTEKTKSIHIEASGPSLNGAFEASRVLQNPKVEVINSEGILIGSWTGEIGVDLKLIPGSYTVILSGVGGSTGIGKLDIWDNSPNSSGGLTNPTARGMTDVTYPISINFKTIGSDPVSFAIKGDGPSFVSNALAEPRLLVSDSGTTKVALNDNWQDDVNASLLNGAGLAPQNSFESAIFLKEQKNNTFSATLGPNDFSSGIGQLSVHQINL